MWQHNNDADSNSKHIKWQICWSPSLRWCASMSILISWNQLLIRTIKIKNKLTSSSGETTLTCSQTVKTMYSSCSQGLSCHLAIANALLNNDITIWNQKVLKSDFRSQSHFLQVSSTVGAWVTDKGSCTYYVIVDGGGGVSKWLQDYIGVVWQMITVLHRG